MLKKIKEILKGKVKISSAIFLMLSAIIRVLAVGCFGLAFYVKYGDRNLIDDIEFAALNTINLYGMPLATYIQGLVFGSITVFVTESVCGIVGIIASVKQKQSYLMAYISLCLVAVLVYFTHMVLWCILQAGVDDGSIKAGFDTYSWRYCYGNMLDYSYRYKWIAYYAHVSCCGSIGNCCYYKAECFERFSVRVKSYIRTYLFSCCMFILFQVLNIIAADYTIIKLQLKEHKQQISDQKICIICIGRYGMFPTLWGFIKQCWERSRMCLFSVLIKSANIICSVGLVMISIHFISSDFVSTGQLLPLFRQIYVHKYSYHDIAAGFGSSVLAIGCLGIGVGVTGLIGSKLQRTILQTVSFFMTILLLMLKIIAVIFCSVMYNEFVASNEYNLNAYAMYSHQYSDSSGIIAINRLMVNFRCCDIKGQLLDKFCWSDIHESVVQMNFNYFNSIYYWLYPIYVNGSYSYKKCSAAVESSVAVYGNVFLAFLALGIIMDSLGLAFISKEFKETQTKNFASNRSDVVIDGKHLIPWLLYIYKKEKPRNLYVLINIITTVLMLMLEVSFIVLAAIFSVSDHVNKDFINAIGNFYKSLAISGIVLVTSSMIVRIVALVGTFNKFKKTLEVSTAFMVLLALLNLAYIVMAAVLRNDKYPCSYRDLTYSSHDCSIELLSSSGVAIGMFVIELVTQIVHLTLFLYDIKTKFAHSRVNPGFISLIDNTSARSPDNRNVLSETNF